jgi:hypothetical protein
LREICLFFAVLLKIRGTDWLGSICSEKRVLLVG